jgi:hypothetical protein
VTSPKTARYGKGVRVVPIFPELLEPLEACRAAADTGQVFVIESYRDASNSNLRTQLLRIIKRAGIEAWPRLFSNLRASRAVELKRDFSGFIESRWLGHSAKISDQHYDQVIEDDFARASGQGAQIGPEPARKHENAEESKAGTAAVYAWSGLPLGNARKAAEVTGGPGWMRTSGGSSGKTEENLSSGPEWGQIQ